MAGRDCGECSGFVAYAEQHFGWLLARYHFEFVQCSADYHGRECTALYQSDRCRLLFTRIDGSEDCSLGPIDAPSPGSTMVYLDGTIGWYDTMLLIEFASGRKLLTQRRIDDIWAGKLDYLQWLSSLLPDWADRLVAMVEPGNQLLWHKDFMRFVQTRR